MMISQQEPGTFGSQSKNNSELCSTPALPYLKTIHHSSAIISASTIKIFENNQQNTYFVLAKTSSLDFYYFKSSVPIFSHSVDLYVKISAFMVIPTRHQVSDSIFIVDSQKKYTLYRPKPNKRLDIIRRRTLEFEEANLDGGEKVHSGIHYIFNSNDTEGYIYYSLNSQIAIIKFSEKIDGFHELSFTKAQIPKNSTILTNIPRSKSRYKQETIAICYYMSKQIHMQLFDLQLNQFHSNLKKIKLSVVLAMHAGTQLVIVDTQEIKLYNYDFGQVIQTFKQPNFSSIKKVINLTNTYCGVGDNIVIFNKLGINHYGKSNATDVRHLGNNVIVVWHQYQNTKLIKLKDNDMEIIQEWVNLGPIEDINVLENDGEESYIVKSPLVKSKPISIVSNALGFVEIAKQQLSDGSLIKNVFVLQNNTQELKTKYVLVSSFFLPSRIFKINNISKFNNISQDKHNILEQLQISGIQQVQQPLATHENFIITSKGIYKLQTQSIINYYTFEEQISKAHLNSKGMIVIEIDQKKIQYFNINNPSIKKIIPLQKQLSSLTVYSPEGIQNQRILEFSVVVYCSWGSRKLHIISSSSQNKIKILREARSLYVNDNNLFIGYSSGNIQIYENNNFKLISSFVCGTAPVFRIFQINNKIYALSNKSCEISSYSPNQFSKRNLLLENINSLINLSSPPEFNLILTSYENVIQLSTVDLSTNVHIKELDISLPSNFDPQMITIPPYIYFFTPFRTSMYQINESTLPTEFAHDLSTISCKIQKWQDDFIIIAGKVSTQHAILVMKRQKQCGVFYVNNQPLALKTFGNNNLVVCSENQVRFFTIEERKLKQNNNEGNQFLIEDKFSKNIDVTPYTVDVLPEQQKLIIGDTVRSILLCSYNLSKEKLHVLSKFSLGNLSLDISFLGNYILQSDNSNNLFLLSGNLGSPNQLQRIILSFNGGLHLNQSIWVMSKTKPSLSNHNKQQLVYGTSNGSIGKISLLPGISSQKFKTFFKNIEQLVLKQSFKHSQYSGQCSSNLLLTILNKQYQNLKSLQRNKFNMKDNSLLNGDLVEYITKTQQTKEIIESSDDYQRNLEELGEIRRLINDLSI